MRALNVFPKSNQKPHCWSRWTLKPWNAQFCCPKQSLHRANVHVTRLSPLFRWWLQFNQLAGMMFLFNPQIRVKIWKFVARSDPQSSRHLCQSGPVSKFKTEGICTYLSLLISSCYRLTIIVVVSDRYRSNIKVKVTLKSVISSLPISLQLQDSTSESNWASDSKLTPALKLNSVSCHTFILVPWSNEGILKSLGECV